MLVVEAADGKAEDVANPQLTAYQQDQVAFYGNYAEFAQAQSNVENAVIGFKDSDLVVMVIASNECSADLSSAVDSALGESNKTEIGSFLLPAGAICGIGLFHHHKKEADAVVFSTILFLFRFLPITLALYYLAPAKLKNTVLFVCSLVFYCWGEVRFFPVMLALILINYLCGLGLEAFDAKPGVRKVLLLVALAASLGMLFYFKYANFVLRSINSLLGTGFAAIQGISVLPLGISFLYLPNSFLYH